MNVLSTVDQSPAGEDADPDVNDSIIDTDAEPFDIMAAPEADINLPIEERKPGGLGIHLIRKMVDTIQYSYVAEQRTSRITFRKTEKINVDD